MYKVSEPASEVSASVTISVERSAGSAGQVSVNYATSDGSAKAGEDYESVGGTLDFPDGVVSQTFRVAILDDEGAADGDKTVNLDLSQPKGGAIRSGPSSAILTILDDDHKMIFLPIVMK